MIKKLIIILISSIFASSLVSCKTITINFGDETSSVSSSTESTSSENDTSSSLDSSSTVSTSSAGSSSKESNSSSNSTSSTENSNTDNSSNNSNNNTKSKEPEKTEVTVNINDNSEYYVQNPVIPEKIYHSNSFIFPQSSKSYLTHNQVSALNNYELGIARNEIYARHGYTFDLAQFRNYFNSQSWYTPIGKNVSLSKVEQYNVDLIKSEENRRGVTW